MDAIASIIDDDISSMTLNISSIMDVLEVSRIYFITILDDVKSIIIAPKS